MRVANLARRGESKIHWVGSRDVDDPKPAPGTIIAGRSMCGRVGFSEDWTIVDQRLLRDLPDGGESQMCRWCD